MTTTSDTLSGRWRTVDIVTAAVLAVAFGAVFQAWNVLWEATTWVLPPFRGIIYGTWMLPAVLVPLVLRRPGAALLAETVAASAEILFGAPWGLWLLVYGLAQGAAAELVFAFGLYRRWGLVAAMAAGGAAGVAGALLDLLAYYPEWGTDWMVLYTALVAVSSALIAGLGGWLLVRALARTGVLGAFPAGREQPEV
ncbi:MAG TPA: ECF transporter S component [Candidatus Limnocylindria bacterium]|jgi:energy-coupling factor transport system substrate-specific component|nr:ECF transporter S component [Candidatus Limnocylindria bacterium]